MRTHVFCKYLITEKHELKDGACGLRNPIARSPQVQVALYITHAGLGSFFWLPNAFTMVTGHAFFCTWSGASMIPDKIEGEQTHSSWRDKCVGKSHPREQGSPSRGRASRPGLQGFKEKTCSLQGSRLKEGHKLQISLPGI